MVYSLQYGLVESAGRAHPGMAIKRRGLRLDSSDEEKHDLSWKSLQFTSENHSERHSASILIDGLMKSLRSSVAEC